MKRIRCSMAKWLSVFMVHVATCVSAAPMVTNVTAIQQYPWENKVYITYKVVGDIAASIGSSEEPFLVIAAKDKATGCVYAEARGSYLSGDTGAAAGVHKVVWDIGAQGIEAISDKVTFVVQYCYGYLVIDLSAGADALSYPVAYLGGVPANGWTDDYKTNKLVLRRIPAGTFEMQNKSNVTLTRSFYMGVFEVTQKQYQLVMGANPSSYKGDTLPVGSVSYNMIRGSSDGAGWPSSSAVDSDSFLGKLRARTGLNLDLPTEAQWEYACRAGTTSAYNNGGDTEDDLRQLGRYSSNRSDGKGGGSQYTTVGSYLPNEWGLYDMHGNVNEWCLDWSGFLIGLAYGTDPQGPSTGSGRVYRGGGSFANAAQCTSTFRHYREPSYTYVETGNGVDTSLGFRLVRTLSNE